LPYPSFYVHGTQGNIICYSLSFDAPVLHEAGNSIGHFLTSSNVRQVVLSTTSAFSGIFWLWRLYCRSDSAQAKSKEV